MCTVIETKINRKMSKNLIVGLLAILSIATSTFGYVQMRRAQTNASRALEFEKLYNEAKKKVDEQNRMVEAYEKLANRSAEIRMECEKNLELLKRSCK